MAGYSNEIAELLAIGSETDKVEFAHFLANNLGPAGHKILSPRMREIVAAPVRGGRS